MIVDAPWYVPNTAIRRDLQIPTVKEEIRRYISQCSARLSYLADHINMLPHLVCYTHRSISVEDSLTGHCMLKVETDMLRYSGQCWQLRSVRKAK
jgi:hypothetical protein